MYCGSHVPTAVSASSKSKSTSDVFLGWLILRHLIWKLRMFLQNARLPPKYGALQHMK
jgi:hypothetical protein